MKTIAGLLTVMLMVTAGIGFGADTKAPHIGYVYPAGGQRGTTFTICVGGQFLRGAKNVYVTGEGVEAKVVKYLRPFYNLNGDQRALLQAKVREIRDARIRELPSGSAARHLLTRNGGNKPIKSFEEVQKEKVNVRCPEPALLYGMDTMSLRELGHALSMLFIPRAKKQQNRQLAESVMIEVTIAADAVPGPREIRLDASTGLSNPMVFYVGLFPEIRELEPNNGTQIGKLSQIRTIPKMIQLPDIPDIKPIDLPVTINGQIMPGDVDRFRFTATKGQKLVIETHARSLVPYLADAVPGWFQATTTLYNKDTHEIAFSDDFRFDPDPVMYYEIPADGEYDIEIHDSIYRGREDFVYRMSIGSQPFITSVFPLGGRAGTKYKARIDGWNLPQKRLEINAKSSGLDIYHTAYHSKTSFSNEIPYVVDTLPECNEQADNDSAGKSQLIEMPMIVNGRIEKTGDTDVFRVQGKKGDTLVAEVTARRLNSPLDSLVKISNSNGKVIAFNDDYILKEKYLHKDLTGLTTHHADSYVMVELPDDGTYYVQLSDTQNHGGQAYAYRLRISTLRPDFLLRATPSSSSVRNGGVVPMCVHVMRKDGFDGAITLSLKNAPEGFSLSGNSIPAGCNRVCMTVATPPKSPGEPVALTLVGTAQAGGRKIVRTAVAADDTMQAFLYRHLMPAKELVVNVQKNKWPVPAVTVLGQGPIEIPSGGSAQVIFKTKKNGQLKQLVLELDNPPDGVTVSDTQVVEQGLACTISVDKDGVKKGFFENLILDAYREFYPKSKDGKESTTKRRYKFCTMPAVPIKVR